MVVITVSNLKGGVGKSFLVHTLGSVLSRKYKTLLVDLDSQGTLSTGLNVSGGGMAEVMAGEKRLSEIVVKVGDRLWLAPSSHNLSNVEIQLVSEMGREARLRKALAGDYDVVLVDTQTSLNILSLNGLVAADGVLVPVKAEGAGIRAIPDFYDTVDEVKEVLNPELEIIGVVINHFDGRLNHHVAGRNALKNAGYDVIGTISRTVRIPEAFTYNQTVIEYAPKNKAVSEIIGVTREVEQWLRKRIKKNN